MVKTAVCSRRILPSLLLLLWTIAICKNTGVNTNTFKTTTRKGAQDNAKNQRRKKERAAEGWCRRSAADPEVSDQHTTGNNLVTLQVGKDAVPVNNDTKSSELLMSHLQGLNMLWLIENTHIPFFSSWFDRIITARQQYDCRLLGRNNML